MNLDQWECQEGMSLKDISYLELWQPLFRWSKIMMTKLSPHSTSFWHLVAATPQKQDGNFIMCDYTTYRVYNFHRHAKKQRNAQTLICNICGKNFKSHKGLKLHILEHLDSFKYRCTVCKRDTMLDLRRRFTSPRTRKRRSICVEKGIDILKISFTTRGTFIWASSMSIASAK